MSIKPPPRPLKGQEIPADWFPQLYDYVRSLELRGDLKTTQVKRDRSGTVVHAYSSRGSQQPRITSITAVIDVDNGDGTYDATEQKNTAGVFADDSGALAFDSGNNGNLYEINGLRGVPVGSIVIVHRIDDTDGGPLWYFDGQQLAYGVNGSGAWVEITAGTNPYSWKQKDPDATTDTSPAVTGTSTLYEVNGVKSVPVGTKVRAWRDGTYFRCEYFAPVLMPVTLTQTGGSAGNASTECSFTYTVTSLGGTTLLTGASPVWNRPALGKMIAATYGTAYVNASGTVILYQVDEVFDVAACS